MANIPVNPGVNMDVLKSRILNPSLTSFYSVIINTPKDELLKYIESDSGIKFEKDLFELTCIETSLPGSSLATLDAKDDYMGITQKHVYRRMYDESIDLTFLVTKDSGYHQIKFFESWIKYASGEDSVDVQQKNFYSRVRYPDDYISEFSISKYERDLGSSNSSAKSFMAYIFRDAYPKSINSMPISYDASEALKVTVSFYYSRYFISNQQYIKQVSPQTTGSNQNTTSNDFNIPVTRQSTFRYSQEELNNFREQARLDVIRRTTNNTSNGGSRRPGSVF